MSGVPVEFRSAAERKILRLKERVRVLVAAKEKYRLKWKGAVTTLEARGTRAGGPVRVVEVDRVVGVAAKRARALGSEWETRLQCMEAALGQEMLSAKSFSSYTAKAARVDELKRCRRELLEAFERDIG